MSFSETVNRIISLSKDNPIIAVVVGLVLLFLLFRKPKLFLGLFLLAAVLALILYFIMDVSSTGKPGKEIMIEKGIHPHMDDMQ